MNHPGGRPLRLPSEADTRSLGTALATVLRPGDLVVLAGPLGAGKTVLAQGIGAGLGVTGPVTSPTFVIARVHRPDPAAGGRFPMVHVDAYRLAGMADVDDLDLDTDLDTAVAVVEWGEGLVEHLTDAHLRIDITRDDDDDDRVRRVALSGRGGDWQRRLADVRVPAG